VGSVVGTLAHALASKLASAISGTGRRRKVHRHRASGSWRLAGAGTRRRPRTRLSGVGYRKRRTTRVSLHSLLGNGMRRRRAPRSHLTRRRTAHRRRVIVI